MYLIIDIETIGFPKRKDLKFGDEPDYKDNQKYDSARMVQLSFMLCNDKLEEISIEDIIIKADGFNINNADIHGITNEISEKEGVICEDALNLLEKYLHKCSYIIAHNTAFDIPIIKNELYRAEMFDTIKEIETKIIYCTMKNTKNLVNIKNKYGIKYPSLAELYLYTFNECITNAHNSKYDVINLHKIVKKLFEEKKLTFDNLCKQ